MGASGWSYRFPHTTDEATSLRALQEDVVARGAFVWPFDPDADDPEEPALPTSYADVVAAQELETYWECGTHSVLDIQGISLFSESGVVQPLTPTEYRDTFGTETPTPADLDRVLALGPQNPLENLVGPPWSGRIATVRENGQPTEVYAWGWSGD